MRVSMSSSRQASGSRFSRSVSVAKLGRLAEHVLGRQHAELDLVDRQQILDVLDLGDRILDLAVDDVLDGQRIDRPAVLGEEFVDQLAGVGERRVHDRQVDLVRRQDDEAAVDLVGVEILVVAELLGDLGEKPVRSMSKDVSLVGFSPNATSALL